MIKKLYAVSDTPDGEKLSSDLGFEESPPASNSTFKQYTLDLETSNTSYARIPKNTGAICKQQEKAPIKR